MVRIGKTNRKIRKACNLLSREYSLSKWEKVFESIGSTLEEEPDYKVLRKFMRRINISKEDLRQISTSKAVAVRRVARILLFFNSQGQDLILQHGLRDPSAVIRSDFIRLSEEGIDRSRLYNQLIKLIREDPDARVRKAAGERLSTTFADLYSVDYQGLPDLSRMLMLDALDGISRSDEELALKLLFSNDRESSFRAARCLCRWNSLERLFNDGNQEAVRILEYCAEFGIVEYLETMPVKPAKKNLALHLARKANRKDIIRHITGSDTFRHEVENSQVIDIPGTEKLFWKIYDQSPEERAMSIKKLHLNSRLFQTSIETVFPPPDHDISSALLFELAKHGKWIDWTSRCADALLSLDPDIRLSAASALVVINPEEASLSLPPLLHDPVGRVRETTRQLLSASTLTDRL